MEIEFEFEMNDLMKFQKNYMKNSKQFRRIKIIALAMMPLIFSVIIMNSFRLFVIDFFDSYDNKCQLV